MQNKVIFAGAALKVPNLRKSRPLTNRVMTTADSGSDSDQTANFTGKVERDDYHILTAENHDKVNVLGRSCTQYYKMHMQQASVGSKIGTSNFDSKRTTDQIHSQSITKFKTPLTLKYSSQVHSLE